MAEQHSQGYYTAMIVAKAFDDPQFAQEFRTAYNEGGDAAVKMLTDTGMPADLANELVDQQDDDLYNFVGKRVCDFLW